MSGHSLSPFSYADYLSVVPGQALSQLYRYGALIAHSSAKRLDEVVSLCALLHIVMASQESS